MADALGVILARGLSSSEAERRLARLGPNELEVTAPPRFWVLLLRQFRSVLVALLLVAAGISLVVGDPLDSVVILAVLAINALIGAVQESRAERALTALREMSAPTARVLRDGDVAEILARDVVPGDVVVIRTGDLIPTDGRLVTSVALQIDESTLTGESLPVDKAAEVVLPPDTPLADRVNMAYAATAVSFGHGRLVATATGGGTELGQLARAMTAARPRATPLEQQVAWLGKVLSLLAIGASLAVFSLGLLRGQSLSQMFLVAVSLAVAAVPEGLPAVVTIVLALGVQRMARRNAIVRRLSSVEALGSATVICTDKTGTLTLGEMRVAVVVLPGHQLEVGDGELLEHGRSLAVEDLPGLPELLRAAVLSNNASLEPTPIGDPTERALLHLARTLGANRAAEELRWPRVGEVPFSSDRKRMTTLHQGSDSLVAFVKGAPDTILDRCSSILTEEGPRPLSEPGRQTLQAAVGKLAGQSLRLLALAQRSVPPQPTQTELLTVHAAAFEQDLTLLGIVGLLDPPRPEVPAALDACRTAGIQVVMITGDHPATAAAIARRLGISDGEVVTGAELDRMDPARADGLATSASVYARVAPGHKVQIVRALQAAGEVVAMTGDGANDAPALKLADIGVAMGIRGTAVAKEAAAMVLADDDFATIVAAVEEGRTIYGNLRKAILYLVSGNLGEILVLFVAMLAGLPLPLQAVQILWINLITDALPAVGLGMEPREADVMSRPPRKQAESFLPAWTAPLILVPSVLLALVTLMAFVVALWREPGELAAAQSTAFATLVLAHIGIGWAQRASLAPSLKLSATSNPVLLASIGVGLGLVLLLLYTGPGQLLFHSRPLDLTAWSLTAALTPLPLLGTELVKAVLVRRMGSMA